MLKQETIDDLFDLLIDDQEVDLEDFNSYKGLLFLLILLSRI